MQMDLPQSAQDIPQKNIWKQITLFLLTISIVIVCILILYPFLSAIIGAIVLAVITQKPYNWLILYGLPFNVGRTLVSGTWVSDAQDMAQHMFLMVDQIRKIDPTSVISVCAAGRATLYMTTLATMMGLHIRIGTEDTPWKHPNSDVHLKDNLEMFNMARDIAGLLGRTPATANEYRALIGKPAR